MNGLAKFLAYLQLSVGTYQMVRQVETSTPEGQSGPTKLDVVVNSIGMASQQVPEIVQHIQQQDAEGFSRSAASMIVTALNAGGIFKKTQKV